MNVQVKSDPELELLEDMAGFEHDPLGFVYYAFPWGEGELAGHTGPMEWQRKVLADIGNGVSPDRALRIGIASGHGIGKSALVSWIILWALSTFEDCIGVVTANTGDQLKLKTWAQLAKWHRLCVTGHWFAVTAKTICSVDPKHTATWRIDAATWNETRTEAFAGLHNEGKRILLLYDESSGIPDVIWDVSTGALTDRNTEIIWAAFGNPTRGTGRFRECFTGGKFAHRWNTQQIDSRTVPITNKEEIDEWVQDYGEDSDFVRVRVRGVFPRASSMQFIPADLVAEAASHLRDPSVTLHDPLVMGVDVGRFGDDKSVIRFRRGRNARDAGPTLKFRGTDTFDLAAKIAELQQQPMTRCDAIFIDAGGPGGGVVDTCRRLKVPVIEVNFGGKPDRNQIGQQGDIVYGNKRAEMWGVMKEWLKGGIIENDADLQADLVGVEYGYGMHDGREGVILEKKEHMKKRGLASPDDGDALALTFAYPIGPSDHSYQFSGGQSNFESRYDPYAQGNKW